MSSDVALRLEGVGKAYRITHQEAHVTLAEQTLHRLRHPFRKPEVETFWALEDVNLEVRRGEVLGLIGRNGAGKSTLLKVLSRITPPTVGRIDVFGRIGSLLEVGTGFHPELTGRENVYLNGAILGMKRSEIDRQFDAIVDFAGVSQFLDTPVKRYSSGMYVRLAFAVAAHLETEILLVDEVLAVGDQEFQDKCLGKMHDVAGQGRTVLFVSHNLDSVQRLCETSAVLQKGKVAYSGDVGGGVALYLESVRASHTITLENARRGGSGEYRVVAVEAVGGPFTPASVKRFRIAVERQHQSGADRYFVSAHVNDSQRRVLAQCDSRLSGVWSDRCSTHQVFDLELRSPWLKPGRYDLDLFLCNSGIIDMVEMALEFEVTADMPYEKSAPDDVMAAAFVLSDFRWEPARSSL